MKCFLKLFLSLLLLHLEIVFAKAPNQTDTLTPVLPSSSLPFQIVIEEETFQLPVGFHSGAVGVYKGLWVFLAGRTNGLHGFNLTNNFPPDEQNTTIYVVNPATGAVASRSLTDPSSGLTQQQVDQLSVTSPQMYQEGATLYMTGGYGVDTATGTFTTKPVLTAFNLPQVIKWVTQPNQPGNLINSIRQIYHPIFQITGGRMFKLGNAFQLIFGQDFEGEYTPGSNGNYSNQIRRFQLKNINGRFSVEVLSPQPSIPDPNYRRRDLNVAPALLNNNNQLQYGLIAYAGVFTLDDGVWTVPVTINGIQDPVMADPNAALTFKQAMNQYISATASLYSRQYESLYHIFFGGISFGYFDGGVFQTDSEIPFINQVTAVKKDKNGIFTQYLMDNEYPVIPSTGSNPGNPLLFGAGAYFIPSNISQYPNTVINLDNIRQPTVIGHIVGGIQSTLPNTNTMSDSGASAYVFKVTLIPTNNITNKTLWSKKYSHLKRPLKRALRHVTHTQPRKHHGSSRPTTRQGHLPV